MPPEAPAPPPWQPRIVAVYLLAVGFLLAGVLNHHVPGKGFTRMIVIGDVFEAKMVPALRAIPHVTLPACAGYDGQFYAQIAVYPTVREPALVRACDSLSYRAKRILFCWTAYLLGLGHPPWVLEAFALQGVLFWLLTAVLLLRWLPPTDGENALRWIGCLFGHGMAFSLGRALLDGPSLFLILLALREVELARPAASAFWLTLSMLGKETSALAALILWPRPLGGLGGLARFGLLCGAIAAPFCLWVVYLKSLGLPLDSAATTVFQLPFVGFAIKLGEVLDLGSAHYPPDLRFRILLVWVSQVTQVVWLLTRWRPDDVWWRLGAGHAALVVAMGWPFWEGYPVATARAALPVTIAFNVLVPRGRPSTWPLLIAGNLWILLTPQLLELPLLRAWL